METKPQADSPQKSPVSKTLPPASREEDSKQQPAKTDTASTSESDQKAGSVVKTATESPKSDIKAESKPEASKGQEESKRNVTDGSKPDTTLSHPIISVDIQKSMPYENKPEVPQESKPDSKSDVAALPTEVLASVVTEAVVNEAAKTVGCADGLTVNGTKVSSDSSKVDSVVEQEINRLNDGKTQLKNNEDAKVESKALPNGDIDHSPVKDEHASTSTEDKKEDSKKEDENSAQSKRGTEVSKMDSNHTSDSSMAPTVVENETSIKVEVAAQNQKDSSVDQMQGSEIGSCNGVPGIITVVGISKKDSAQNLNKEANDLATDSKKNETITEKDNNVKEVPPKVGSGDMKVLNSKQEETNELATLSNNRLDSNDKTEIVSATSEVNLTGDNLTDSAKIQSNVQKIYEEIETVHKKNGSSSGITESSSKIETSSKVSNSSIEQQSCEKTAVSTVAESATAVQPEMTNDSILDKAPDHASPSETKKVTEEKNKPDKEGREKIKDSKLSESFDSISATKSIPSEPSSISASLETKDASSKVDSAVKDDTLKTENNSTASKKDGALTEKAKDSSPAEMDATSIGAKEGLSTAKKDITAIKAKDGTPAVKDDATSKEENDGISTPKKDVTSVTEKDDTSTAAESTQTLNAADMCDMSMMASMTTSQILTEEMLNGGKSVSDKNGKNDLDSKDDVMYDFKFCRISASVSSPVTCDVGVGSDQRMTVRVASGDGGEEEVDGQQATKEIEVTEEANTNNLSHTNVVGDDTSSITSKSPSTSKPASATSSSPPEKPDDKPPSAVSRSSIPEAIVYEPPERRRSAASSANEEKKDEEEDKSHKDEKESEKDKTEDGEDKKSQESIKEDKQEDSESYKKEEVVIAEASASTDDNREAEMDSNVKETAEELAKDEKPVKDLKEKETNEEKEKGEEDEKDVERPESKSEEKADAEDVGAGETKSVDAEDATEKSGEEKLDVNATETKDGADGDSDVPKDKDEAAAKEFPEGGEKVDEKQDNTSEKEDGEKIVEENVAKDEKNKDDVEKADAPKESEEPKTLVEEEESKVDSSKEKEEEEEKEGDESEETKEDKGKEETAAVDNVEKEAQEEIGADGEAEAMKDGEKEQATPEDKVGEEEQPKDEANVEDTEANQKQKDDDAAETKESEEGDNEAEKERKDTEEGETEGEPLEPPPKSPTKRVRSPDKAGRRGSLPQLRLPPKSSNGWTVKGLLPVGRVSPFEGVSPVSSPPKSLKTPPSPQKPQKTTSPKKKNGMLSPIKTPKTPGSDARKLPPIKAPVGLAPNPNLKNIRSKIGSFDNIKYKPGGGDKKVISTKKLEWKAAPKIGSLDHSFKGGEKKRSHSKGGEPKEEGKSADGQSPSGSGDEAEPEETSGDAPETLIKPEGSTEMPVAIAAES